MGQKLSVSESLVVRCTPERLWDFTQDYATRASWDRSILEASVVTQTPVPRVRIRAAGGLNTVFQYKQFDRPRQTSLVMEEVVSFWIEGGGGSWSYLPHAEGTLWTQNNTLILRAGWWRAPLAPLVTAGLRRGTRLAMQRAKQMIEKATASTP